MAEAELNTHVEAFTAQYKQLRDLIDTIIVQSVSLISSGGKIKVVGRKFRVATTQFEHISKDMRMVTNAINKLPISRRKVKDDDLDDEEECLSPSASVPTFDSPVYVPTGDCPCSPTISQTGPRTPPGPPPQFTFPVPAKTAYRPANEASCHKPKKTNPKKTNDKKTVKRKKNARKPRESVPIEEGDEL